MSHLKSVGIRREPLSRAIVQIALLAATLLSSAATAFADGSVSGQVTSSVNGLGIANTVLEFYDLNADEDGPLLRVTTDASGNYLVNLPSGTYGILTQNTSGFINEIYNNIPCSALCDTAALTPVIVGNSAVTGINFVLVPGGRITGRVTRASDGAGIAGVRVYFVNGGPAENFPFTFATTDASGNYTSDAGTADGGIYVATFNTLGYRDEVYTNGAGNPYCLDCDVQADGTLIPVTQASGATNIDFILDIGGQIAGNVKNSSNVPLENAEIAILDATTGNQVFETQTDASGNYTTSGLPAGNYLVNTRNLQGYVDQQYNGITCANGLCGFNNGGTVVTVTLGVVTPNINFTLQSGGTVSGTVTNSLGEPLDVFVGFFTVNSSNQTVFEGGDATHGSGQFSAVLPPGTHYALVSNSGTFANQLYHGLPCASALNGSTNCNISVNGTPIEVVVGASVNNIDFSLVEGGAVSGTVTVNGTATGGIQVAIFTLNGTQVGQQQSSTTAPVGAYTFMNLPPGQYYLRTNSAGAAINQMTGGVVCVQCNVATTPGGTPITVTAGGNTTGTNFALVNGGRILGTITDATNGNRLPNIPVQFFNAAGVQVGQFNSRTDAACSPAPGGDPCGQYGSSGLPPGTYYVKTNVTAANYIDEVWNGATDTQCLGCNVLGGTAVTIVGTTNATNINFALSPGGQVTGTVTNAAGGAPVPGISVNVFNLGGVLLKNALTDASGNYTIGGLATGLYFVRANPSATQNYAAVVYNGSLQDGFPATIGTPVSVTAGAVRAGVNFGLSSGGSLSGTVKGAGNVPLAGVQVSVYNAAGRLVKIDLTDGAGGYSVTGLTPGTYYVSTNAPTLPPPFYQDEVYNNVTCAGCVSPAGTVGPVDKLPCAGPCAPPVTAGTPVTVTNGANHPGVDFVLGTGAGAITGAVTDAVTGRGLVNVQVLVYNAAGVLVKSTNTVQHSGSYSVRGLAPGTYYARTMVTGGSPWAIDEAYNDIPCAPCTITSTTAIAVTANTTTSNINFALSQGGSIGSKVVDSMTGAPLPFVEVQLYNSSGTPVKSTLTGLDGAFFLVGLPAGNYFARTAVPGNLAHYVNELYNNVPCPTTCNVTTGTPITVTTNTTFFLANIALSAPPTIAAIPNVGTRVSTPVVVNITVGSVSGPGGVTLSGSSSNTGLVPNSGLVFGGSGSNRTLTITPVTGQRGLALITVTGSDGTGVAVRTFSLTVGGPVPGDLDGDVKSDITIYRPSVGTWYSLSSSSGFLAGAGYAWGASTDQPLRGDFDGDGRNDIVVYRASSGHWFILSSSTNYTTGPTYQWGIPGDIPVPADYDGDRKTDIAIYRPSSGTWYFLTSSSGFVNGFGHAWGASTDKPIPGDYDGDGRADLVVYRSSSGHWFVRKSSTNFMTTATYQWGVPGDLPVSGDYDGDGTRDLAIYRPSSGTWYYLTSSSGFAAGFGYVWGASTDLPISGDFDGDGRTDIVVYRPSSGHWFVLKSSTSFATNATYQWGTTGDIAVIPGQ